MKPGWRERLKREAEEVRRRKELAAEKKRQKAAEKAYRAELRALPCETSLPEVRKSCKALSQMIKLCNGKKANRIANRKALRRKQQALEYLGNKCVVCGYNRCPAALDFHHRDPESKSLALSRQWTERDGPWDWELVRQELDKCDLLCSNCHRELHFNQRNY